MHAQSTAVFAPRLSISLHSALPRATMSAMIGMQFRAARLAANLSEAELARRAGIQRSQLRALEADGNVEIATMLRVAAHLPDLRTLAVKAGVGATAGAEGTVDLENVRMKALGVIAAAQELLRSLGTPGEVSLPPETLEKIKELDRLVDAAEATGDRDKSH